jgi:hypothetical protein
MNCNGNGIDAMKHSTLYIAAIVAAIIALLCNCSVNPLANGGNSSQTGNNGIMVSMQKKRISGTTRPGARVSMYDQNYRPYKIMPGFCDSTVADDSGRFAIPLIREGIYNLLARDDRQNTWAFISHIPVFADSIFADTVDALQNPGFIGGTASDSTGRILALSYVFISGSPFYSVSSNNGVFILGPLPPGRRAISFITDYNAIDTSAHISTLLSEVHDTAAITVYPGVMSQWHW